jgi:hypothetical protein
VNSLDGILFKQNTSQKKFYDNCKILFGKHGKTVQAHLVRATHVEARECGSQAPVAPRRPAIGAGYAGVSRIATIGLGLFV